MTEDSIAALTFLKDQVRNRNLNDQVDYLIESCILLGICNGSAIRDAISGLGYDAKHVGIRLAKQTGRNPLRCRWGKAEDGTYYQHLPAPT